MLGALPESRNTAGFPNILRLLRNKRMDEVPKQKIVSVNSVISSGFIDP
jgi:hypothetical protein